MSEESYPQENYCLSPHRFEFLTMMKRESFISGYNEDVEWKEIQEEQNIFKQEYQDIEALLWQSDAQKKKFDVQNEIDIPVDPKKLREPLVPTIPQEPGKIQPEDIKLKPKKFLNKSFCRYIVLYAIRTIENIQYADIIGDICSNFQVNYNTFVEYYRKQRILIMGYQALKKELIYDNDTIPNQNRKKAFKEVLVWYLDKLATKHILQSKKQNLKEYLKFKNYVMSYYVQNPKSWAGNKPQWK